MDLRGIVSFILRNAYKWLPAGKEEREHSDFTLRVRKNNLWCGIKVTLPCSLSQLFPVNPFLMITYFHRDWILTKFWELSAHFCLHTISLNKNKIAFIPIWQLGSYICYALLFGTFELIPNATGLTTVTKYMGERDGMTLYAEREINNKNRELFRYSIMTLDF